ncbi:Uncharacterised protein [Mycobacteroides abscessus subsp. abscessus]|nr:Uncharacterised protein [Mycobacteroides abscessus subsp. abscessus]
MNGRRYSDSSPPAGGTHALSAASSARSDSMKSSTGRGGIARRSAERCSRSALASGRNAAIEPSGCRYAFRPSKTSCP